MKTGKNTLIGIKLPSSRATYPNLLSVNTNNDNQCLWGQRRKRYLQQHHKSLYCNLLTSGKLRSHLADIEEEAQSLFLRLVKEYAEKKSVTEQLKAENPTEWVHMMNNIRERVNEVVNAEMIFT